MQLTITKKNARIQQHRYHGISGIPGIFGIKHLARTKKNMRIQQHRYRGKCNTRKLIFFPDMVFSEADFFSLFFLFAERAGCVGGGGGEGGGGVRACASSYF